MQIAGGLPWDYETAIGLTLNMQRVQTRRSHGMLRAIKDAFSPTVPLEYFQAMYADPEEASAMYEIHRSRVESELAASKATEA